MSKIKERKKLNALFENYLKVGGSVTRLPKSDIKEMPTLTWREFPEGRKKKLPGADDLAMRVFRNQEEK